MPILTYPKIAGSIPTNQTYKTITNIIFLKLIPKMYIYVIKNYLYINNIKYTHRFKQSAVLANVAGRREAQSAYKTGAHVGHDVSVQIWHHL